MKLLLTDAGIQNPSIHAALVDMLGKPIEECHALAIPTALYGHPMAGPPMAYKFFTSTSGNVMLELPWKTMAVLELTALPSMQREIWVPLVEQADVFLVAGGDCAYLAHWIRESGLYDLFPDLDAVWVGLSGGSLVMTPRTGRNFINWPTSGADDTMLGLVDFAIFPHLNSPGMDAHTLASAEKWFETMDIPAYVTDDQTAIKVENGEVEVISEGTWKYFQK